MKNKMFSLPQDMQKLVPLKTVVQVFRILTKPQEIWRSFANFGEQSAKQDLRVLVLLLTI